jgi:hypothetical protein
MSIVIDYTKGFFEASPAGETVGDITSSTLDLSTGNVFSDAPATNVSVSCQQPTGWP